MVALAGPVGDELYSEGRTKSRANGAQDDIARAENSALKIALLRAGKPVPESGQQIKIEVSADIINSASTVLRQLRDATKRRKHCSWSTGLPSNE
jgi:hypothetical protein